MTPRSLPGLCSHDLCTLKGCRSQCAPGWPDCWFLSLCLPQDTYLPKPTTCESCLHGAYFLVGRGKQQKHIHICRYGLDCVPAPLPSSPLSPPLPPAPSPAVSALPPPPPLSRLVVLCTLSSGFYPQHVLLVHGRANGTGLCCLSVTTCSPSGDRQAPVPVTVPCYSEVL